MKRFAILASFVLFPLGCSGKSEEPSKTKKHNVVAARTKVEAIAEMKKLKGTVRVDEKSPDKPVIGLHLGYTGITDGQLVHLQQLPDLRSLHLSNNTVTGAGLAHLKGLTKLQSLYLTNTKVNDAGLVHLKKLNTLQTLSLAYTGITDAGLVHLHELSNLQNLFLAATKVSAAGVAKLQTALPKCKIMQ